MLHIPVLRAGVPYRSLNRSVLVDVRNGEPVAEVSQANRGLVSRDLLGMPGRRSELREFGIDELIERCVVAAKLFYDVDRLNLGALPTGVVSWDQPHEGNLFEHLYRQRAYQEEARAS